jgi:hypothetical protein
MSRLFHLIGIFAILVSALGMAVQPAHAADFVTTLKPGEKVTIAVDLWCLNYGKPFPTKIEGPTARPPDDVVKVMQTALKKGTVTSDIYQTQLAIWRATTGEFKDFANKGSDLAKQIWEDSQSATIASPPADAVLLQDAVKDGSLTVTIENFVELPVPGVPGHPFHGKADVIVENVSNEDVTFVLLEGAVFNPLGEDAQALISHQDPAKTPELPKTGGDWQNAQQLLFMALAAAGVTLLLGGFTLRRVAR